MGFPDYKNWTVQHCSNGNLQDFIEQQDLNGTRENLVYLTADSPHELLHLSKEDKYIIGGIVDRNRHKNLCYEKAKSLGIRHARLPIGSFIKLSSRQVLTIDQVVSIMVKYLNTLDWETAFFECIPKRKGLSKLNAPEMEEDQEEDEEKEEKEDQESIE
jgi:tRNA (guanine9-N1)-methyltransferase